MIVARQFTAWDLRGNGTRPVGYGVIGLANNAPWCWWQTLGLRIKPFPTGPGIFGRISGNKLPGYLH
jgi:hypothetical protein